MKARRDLPPRVYRKHGAFWHVAALGDKRIWTRHVFCKQDGQRYTYSGASTAWKRGTQRAGIPNTQFRDLRAKALTDVDERSGIIAAQRMGAHSTQAQTADYIRNKKAIKSTATR